MDASRCQLDPPGGNPTVAIGRQPPCHAGGVKTVIDRFLDLEDLLAIPDDGNRYEVLDGALVMTPPPGTRHQHVVLELAVLLRQAARPLGLQTFVAPVA